MASVNKVILVGNLGRDPEVRHTPNGDMITSASIATTESWKDKGGEKQKKTEWHRLVFFNRGAYKLAEVAGNYLKKGSQVYIEGKLQTRKWQDKDGADKYATEVIVEVMQMIGGKPTESGEPAKRSAASVKKPSTGGKFDDMDDDIPF